jgi:hypothetical protein
MSTFDVVLAVGCFLCAGHMVGTFVAALVRFMRCISVERPLVMFV